MDPNTTYQWITEAWVRFDAANTDAERLNIAREIHDYWDALDQWMQNGGFLPKVWDTPRI